MDAEKIAARAKEIAEEIKDRRMIFTDQDWPDDTGDQYDKVYTYAYYLYAGIPVRIHIYNRPTMKWQGIIILKKDWAGAEKLNFRTGAFDYDNNLRISMEYDEDKGGGDVHYVSSKEEFYKNCDEYMVYNTPERIAQFEKNLIRDPAVEERMKKLAYEAEVKAGLHQDDDRK